MNLKLWEVVLFLYCPKHIDNLKEERISVQETRYTLLGVPWLLFPLHCYTTPEIYFALCCTVETHPPGIKFAYLEQSKISKGRKQLERKTADYFWMGNTWTEGGCGYWHPGSGTVMNLSVLLKLNQTLPLKSEICLYSQQTYLK